MNPTKHCLKKWGEERGEWKDNVGVEPVQGMLYECMELSQWNPLILLMCANFKIQ
jgi:hypothetical protein